MQNNNMNYNGQDQYPSMQQFMQNQAYMPQAQPQMFPN